MKMRFQTHLKINDLVFSGGHLEASVSWRQTIIPKPKHDNPVSVFGIRLHLSKKGLKLFVFSFAILLTAASGYEVSAKNTDCVVGGSSATCPDVPVDGISYTSGIDTVNVGDGIPGITVVNSGVAGIELTRVGDFGADATAEATFLVLEDYDIDPTATEDLADVVSADGTTPLLIDGNFIFTDSAEPPTYTIETDN